MEVSTICIIGGAVVVAGVVGYACYKKYAKSEDSPAKMTDVFNTSTDEQLVVDNLDGRSLTSWFRAKNPEKKYSNVILYPSLKNINQFNLPKNIEVDAGNMVIQAIFDDKADKVVLCRSVMFETMESNLSNMLEQNDGMIIVE